MRCMPYLEDGFVAAGIVAFLRGIIGPGNRAGSLDLLKTLLLALAPKKKQGAGNTHRNGMG